MKPADAKLVTPIYVKTTSDMPWPKENVFYVLSGKGLFLCRNHRFFQSSVPARSWPLELAGHERFLHLKSPKVPRDLMELAVGFFAEVGERCGAEAALVLLWDEREKHVRLIAPKQLCTVYKGWNGKAYPIGVNYELPEDLPADWTIFGDLHSHVDSGAYTSVTDRNDENYRPGLHVVVGRIYLEPPEIHAEAVVDGVRFPMDSGQAIEGYRGRRTSFPREWLSALEIESYPSYSAYWYDGYGAANYKPPSPSYCAADACFDSSVPPYLDTEEKPKK